MRPKPKSEPWLNDVTPAARRERRRTEHKWKKDKLHVSYDLMRDSWKRYQKIVKEEKTKHFSDIISSHFNKPRIIFKTIDSILNVTQSTCLEASSEVCEKFLAYFVGKVENIRVHISPSLCDTSISHTCPVVLNQFEPVSFFTLSKIVTQLKPTGSPTDVIPPRLFKEVWETTGQNVQKIINSSLASGTVPVYFKQAIVEPLIKKPNLDLNILSNYRPI